ncbi:hypothetical protein RM555_28000 [Micromonospora sp. DSM 115977]|uniref:Thioesterase domain-containing protein n=1 Tax=Micromonospora reichwaldensis TaxID=3075516 RepID=A0ABU2X3S4_9ACTN|nr:MULTISPECIES: hypothetical protein [unclassified Micromonospora]KAB1145536.1 hypothetical protein F6X68_19665 [Micromonospora sp. AMSO12t]MDT0532846.1 hypothetical protein [Micromonospora sp. DSM 115977]WSG04669.1 hypothetical protein OG989_13640 [Micromonospora sp. NBC_01740]
MKKNSWQILRKGGPGGLTLTVDFTSTGRTQACFRDLVPLLSAPGEIWETVAPASGAEDTMSGADYVERWAKGVRRRERTVDTVIGYCVGAVFAAPLASRLAESQDEAPRLVLLDPELPNIVGLYRDFHAAADALRTILTPEEIAAFHADGQAVQEKHGLEDLTLIGPALAGIFSDAIDVAGRRLGLDDDVRAELGGSFASFVGYLRAATEIDPAPQWATATAITSAHSTQRGQGFGRTIPLAVDHDQMLRHPDVAATVSGLMTGADAGQRIAG